MSKSINNQLQPDMIEACYQWVKTQFFTTTPKRPIAKAHIAKQATCLTASKIGGFPYLPLGKSLPVNDDNKTFYLSHPAVKPPTLGGGYKVVTMLKYPHENP